MNIAGHRTRRTVQPIRSASGSGREEFSRREGQARAGFFIGESYAFRGAN
jgi:hypothetical protein